MYDLENIKDLLYGQDSAELGLLYLDQNIESGGLESADFKDRFLLVAHWMCKYTMTWAMKTDREIIKLVVGAEKIRISIHCGAIPPDIMLLRNLKVIDACQSGIRSLPSSIGQLQNLEALFLDGTYVKSLPDSVKSLRKLTHVDMLDNGVPPHQAKRIKELLPEGCEFLY